MSQDARTLLFLAAIVVPIVTFGVTMLITQQARARRLRERTEQLAADLGLRVIEPGWEISGRRGAAHVTLRWIARASFRGGHRVTSCGVALDPPLGLRLVVRTPPVVGGVIGLLEAWRGEVRVQARDPDVGRALVARLAPALREAAAHEGTHCVEVDDVSVQILLDDHVVDEAKLCAAVDRATILAAAVRALVPA